MRKRMPSHAIVRDDFSARQDFYFSQSFLAPFKFEKHSIVNFVLEF
jgi:hypothetical protein